MPRSLLKRSKANLSRLVKEPLINSAFSKIHSPCWFMLFGLASLFPLLLACEQPTRVGTPPGYTVVESPAQMVVLDAARDTLWWIAADKFRHGASAAVSITYDAPFGTHPRHHLTTAAVLQRDLRLDLEVVSAIYLTPRWRHLTDYYRTELMPQGIRFFGHGHTHALHDTMTFDAAYESFRTNFRLMTAWGLDPKGYAYPGSSGLRRSTQAANRAAGFIAARGATLVFDEYFIAPYEEEGPKNWFYLPSVVMGNASYRYVDRHEKLLPILDEAVTRRAWIILMYHAIGIPEGWSYYPIADFEQDLDAIVERDFWSANFDAAACYLQERAQLRIALLGVDATVSTVRRFRIGLDDGLPDSLYSEPLTMRLCGGGSQLALDGPEAATAHVLDDGCLRFDALPDGSVYELTVAAR